MKSHPIYLMTVRAQHDFGRVVVRDAFKSQLRAETYGMERVKWLMANALEDDPSDFVTCYAYSVETIDYFA